MTDLIQKEELEQLKEIMEDEFEMLTSMYIADSGKLINEVKAAVADNNAEAARIAAHTLKGSSSNMCVSSLCDLAKQIEDKARDNDMSDMDVLISSLDEVYPQVVTLLQNA